MPGGPSAEALRLLLLKLVLEFVEELVGHGERLPFLALADGDGQNGRTDDRKPNAGPPASFLST